MVGKYLDDALNWANMTQAELARRADLSDSSYIAKVMKDERGVDRETLIHWCAILECPEWLKERILNAAGYASERQQQAVSDPSVVEESHHRVLEEAKRRTTESPSRQQ